MACRLTGAKPLSKTNAGLLLIGPLGTNFSEILIEILTFSFKKVRLKVSSAKRRPFCLGLNVLIIREYSNFITRRVKNIFQYTHAKESPICRKPCFALIPILTKWSLQNFAHVTTAVLSWHVQKFVVIGCLEIELQHNGFVIKFELWLKQISKWLTFQLHWSVWLLQTSSSL